MTQELFTCPVCGYPAMQGPAEGEAGFPTFEICSSCGTEFGTDDQDMTYDELRDRWIRAGKQWWSQHNSPPPDWDATEQLARAGLTPEERNPAIGRDPALTHTRTHNRKSTEDEATNDS